MKLPYMMNYSVILIFIFQMEITKRFIEVSRLAGRKGVILTCKTYDEKNGNFFNYFGRTLFDLGKTRKMIGK